MGERGEAQWQIPLPNGEMLEFIRTWTTVDEDRAGERAAYKSITFKQKVVNAEVFLSGFGIRQTRGGDTELAKIRVDCWIDSIGAVGSTEFKDPLEVERSVTVKVMFNLEDEDPTGPEDFNDAAIGFTVIAHTVKQTPTK